MTFFYDLNKKLDSIREKPETTHKQLNERDEGKPGKNFAKIAKDAGERYGSKAAGERVAGAVRNKLKAQGKLEEESMSRAAKGYEKYGKEGMEALAKAGREGKALDPIRNKYDKYDDKSVDEGMGDIVKKMGALGKKVGGAVLNNLGHGDDEAMRKDLQRKMGVPKQQQHGKPSMAKSNEDYGPMEGGEPMTAKQKSFAKLAPPADKITFADKIAGAKKEVDERLGDVAAEAIKGALSGKQKQLDKNQNGKLDANDFAMLRKGAGKKSMGETQGATTYTVAYKDPQKPDKSHSTKVKATSAAEAKAAFQDWNHTGRFTYLGSRPDVDTVYETDDDNPFTSWKKPRKETPPRGSVEHGRKHDIKHDTTDPKYSGRIVTRRVDPSGISVGADDEAAQSGEKRGRGRPAGTGSKMGAKGPSGRSKLMTKENDLDPAEKGEYDQEGDMAKDSIKTVVRHAQALEKILGDNDNLPEWVQSKLAKIESMMTAVDDYMQNQEGDEEMAMGEESTNKRDNRAERAGRKVTKDIEYDEKKKDHIHGKKRGSEDEKAEKAGKRVAKDIEYDEKKDSKEDKPKKVKEQGGTDTPTASSGFSYGKGIYDSMNRELEKMIAESMSVNMSDSTEGGKSLTITATDEDALKLAGLLKNAGLGGGEGMGQEMGQSEESCSSCGMSDCGCGDVHEALDENNPDWPTEPTGQEDNINYYDTDGLNGRKSTGQSTVPVLASQEDRQHTYEDDQELRRMMEMSGIQQDNLKPWEQTMKEDAEEETKGMAEEEELEESFEQTLSRMRDIAGIKEDKKAKVDYDEDGKIETGAEEHAGSVDKAIKKAQAEKKVDESIFALTNQWTAYKG